MEYHPSGNPYLSLLTGKTWFEILKEGVIKTECEMTLSVKSPTPPKSSARNGRNLTF